MIAASGSFFSGLAAIFDRQAGPVLATAGIIDNHALLFVCLIGACGGAMVSLIFAPPQSQSVRYLACKFLGSGLVSAMFAPYAIQHLQADPSPEFVLFVSGAMALCAVFVIRLVKHFLEDKAGKLLGADFVQQTEEDEDGKGDEKK